MTTTTPTHNLAAWVDAAHKRIRQLERELAEAQRERIAVAAMQGMLAGRQATLDTPYVTYRSLEIADALIAKLKEESK